MPDIRPDFRYTVTLTKAELRIVGLALLGRLDPALRVDAAKLNRDVLQQVAQLHRDAAKVNEGALSIAEQAINDAELAVRP